MISPATVKLRRGGLYFSREIYDRHFAGLEAIVLLRRGDDLAILPVRHAAAGGYVLKQRNSLGDRVAQAPEFFRANGVDDEVETELMVFWSTEDVCLVAYGLFSSQS